MASRGSDCVKKNKYFYIGIVVISLIFIVFENNNYKIHGEEIEVNSDSKDETINSLVSQEILNGSEEIQPNSWLSPVSSELPPLDFMNESSDLKRLSRAVPAVPGDSEVLTDVFRPAIGTGPSFITSKLLRITPALNSQRGAIWSLNKLDLARDFKLKAYLYLGDSRGSAADGITFTLQNDDRMNTSASSVLGDPGMGIGAYSNSRTGQYVRNAISIEFDTYFNNGTSNRMDREVGENSKKGHIAFVTPKANNNNYTGEHSGITLSPDFLSNGEWRELEITWSASTKSLKYFVAGVGEGTQVINNLTTQFGGTEVYWGFTASTGSFNAENVIAISELPQSITQTAKVENVTQGTEATLTTEAIKGEQVKYQTEIVTSTFVNPSVYDGSVIQVDLPAGVQPDLATVMINNVTVPTTNIDYEDEQLTINNVKLSGDGKTSIGFQSEIVTNLDDVTFNSTFSLLSTSGQLISQSNSVSIVIPKKQIGEVLVKYVDEFGKSIQEDKRLRGKIGDPYKEEAIVLDGYQFVKFEGDNQGTFKGELQTLIVEYMEASFRLKQEVTKVDGSDATEISNTDQLTYTVTLESLFTAAESTVTYKSATITELLSENLETIDGLILKTKEGTSVGTVRYDEPNHRIIAEIKESDNIKRLADLILTFNATVKQETVGETLIKVQANGATAYSDGMIGKNRVSNEVQSRIVGKLSLITVPEDVDFGTVSITDFQKKVGVDKSNITKALVVEDTRKTKKKWEITAQIEKEMTNGEDVQVGSLKYVLNKVEKTLNSNAQTIYANDGSTDQGMYNISDGWGKADLEEGLKLQIESDRVPNTSGSYEGIIRWTLRDTIE